jgi:hypothetical protein
MNAIANTAATEQAEISYYLCGGTGTNIGALLKETTRTEVNKLAQMVALDASGANKSKDLFPVERMRINGNPDEVARGSGKVQSTHYNEQTEAYVAGVMTKHKPKAFSIIVCNDAGGTGSMLAGMIIRYLAQRDLPFVLMLISDFSSQVEMANGVRTMRNIANQTSQDLLNCPIPFIHLINSPENTRGEVNKVAVERLDLLSLFLTEGNEEMDYQDVKNYLNYSKHYGVPPALSQIRFYDQDGYTKYDGKVPVAVASLFESADEISSRFEGCVIRTTGVFKANAQKPKNVTEMHMIMDHGDALKDLEARIEKLDERKVETKNNFVPQKSLATPKADGNGFSFD